MAVGQGVCWLRTVGTGERSEGGEADSRTSGFRVGILYFNKNGHHFQAVGSRGRKRRLYVEYCAS